MFDPRLMANDGSSYSRNNALALPGVGAPAAPLPQQPQPVGLPTPISGSNAMNNPQQHRMRGGWQGFDGIGGLFGSLPDQLGQRLSPLSDYFNTLQDWRGTRPELTGTDMGARYQQLQDWRSQRPSFRSVFQGI